MVKINAKIFIGVLLFLVVTISASVSYLTAQGWRVNYGSGIDLEVELEANLTTFDNVDQDQKYPAITFGISREDIVLMEKIVTAEAYGEPLKGKIAVANVVINRVNSAWYPDSIEEVIYQKGQFNPTWDGSLERVKEIDVSVKEAVEQALMGYQAVAKSTLFFLNEDIATDFTIPNTRPFEKKIGNHSFYR